MLPEPLARVGADHFFVDFVHFDRLVFDGFVAAQLFRGRRERRAHFYRKFERLDAAQCEGHQRRACEDGEGRRACGGAGLVPEERSLEAVVAVLVGERAEAAVFAQHGYDAHHRRFFVDGLEARGRAQRRYELALERAVGVAHDAAEGPAAREPRGRELPVAEVRGEYYDAFAAREGVFHVFRAFDADGHAVDERRVVLPREQLDAGPYHVLVRFGEYAFALGAAFFREAEHYVAARDVFADAEEFDERDERQREGLGPPAWAYAPREGHEGAHLHVGYFFSSLFVHSPAAFRGVGVLRRKSEGRLSPPALYLRYVCVRYLNFMRRKSFFPTLSCA